MPPYLPPRLVDVPYAGEFALELEDEHRVDRGHLLQEPIRGHLAGLLGERNNALAHDRHLKRNRSAL